MSGVGIGPLAERIKDLVTRRGPLTGAEVRAELAAPEFALWRACTLAPALELHQIGSRYLRLDRTLEGYARLSPSILREFLTYTIVSTVGDPRAADAVQRLTARVRVISRAKVRLAGRIAAEAFDPLVGSGAIPPESFCVLVAGDIVHQMGHDVARRESSTGQLVEGSDLDLLVLVDDDAAELAPLLDEALLARKWLYLRNPAFREEVDYVVKPFRRLVEQARFDTFTHMVACKVYLEAQPLYGNTALHERALAMLHDHGVAERLAELEVLASGRRIDRVATLLARDEDSLPPPERSALYTEEERAEFEH